MIKQIFKKSTSLLIAGVVLASYSASAQTRNSERVDNQFEVIKCEFKEPDSSFRPAPLWVWNSKVTHADIDRMLVELKEGGFGGAFVHPRSGLVTEYLSDEWFELYKYSVERGKVLGLDIWIYDENSYPSGFAGGHVPAEMPESYNEGQGLDLVKCDVLPANVQDYFICLQKKNDGFIDITNSVNKFKERPGTYYLYKKNYYGKSDWHGGYSYVDLLHKGVTEKFLEVTMSGYEKTFKDELGTTIKGLFSDEPHIQSPQGMRWTPDLFEVFRKQWGYDLKNLLPLLNEETGNWRQVRHNYMETLLQLFIDRWAKPMHDYCEAKNMKWTGHYWEHEWPELQLGPDNMAMYAWHQMPAVDMLFNQFNDDAAPQAQFGNVRAIKELRSVANQMGYNRTLSETYGGGGWEVSFEDLKRLGDWEYALGVNFMNQHLVHMTLTGSRKYDYPPVFSYHATWWAHYRVLNDYYARLSYVLSSGEQLNDIIILEPTTTLWSYYSHQNKHDKVMEIGKNFQSFVTKLEKAQVEYDLGCENIIKDHGKIEKALFTVGERKYKKVVIPPLTENLNKETFLLLKRFADNGGGILCFASPTMIDGQYSKELIDFINQKSANIETYTELTDEIIDHSFADNRIKFSNISGGDLYHQTRICEDGEILFMVNSSLKESVTAEILSKGGTLLELDAMSGDIYAFPQSKNGAYISAQITLPPAGSLLLFNASSPQEQFKVKSTTGDQTILPTEDLVKVRRMKDNVLNIDFCDLIIHDKRYEKMHVSAASDIMYQQIEFTNGNPWNTSIQYRRKIVDRDTLTTGRVVAQYNFRIADQIDSKQIRLVTEQPNLWRVKINGIAVAAIENEWWLDKSFGVYAIGDYIKSGDNTVELSVSPISIYAEIEPVYILGDFAVTPTTQGWEIKESVKALQLGSWRQQGQPFYSWDVAYSKDYDITDLSLNYAVKLAKWNGTLSEVYVNDQFAGIIAFQPNELNISSCLKQGKNKIEVRIIGSLKNLLGPHHREPGPGFVSPWHWKGINEYPSGNSYQMLDYGLLEDFTLVSSKKLF